MQIFVNIWLQEIYFIQIQYAATVYMHNIRQHTIIIKLFTFQYVPLSSRTLLSQVCPENFEFQCLWNLRFYTLFKYHPEDLLQLFLYCVPPT